MLLHPGCGSANRCPRPSAIAEAGCPLRVARCRSRLREIRGACRLHKSMTGHKASRVRSQIAPLNRSVCTRERPCPNGVSDSTSAGHPSGSWHEIGAGKGRTMHAQKTALISCIALRRDPQSAWVQWGANPTAPVSTRSKRAYPARRTSPSIRNALRLPPGRSK